MVERLGSLTRAIATLRRSVRESGAGTLRQPATGSTAQRVSDLSLPAAQSQVATLALRLAALRRDDPQRARKALRLFIEAVLLDEFGAELILSADFERLVDRALPAIEADDSLRETLAQAMKDLLPE